MKRLLLLRHAKTVPSSPAGDFERELAPRGRHEAAVMGAYLAGEGLMPDAILASSARRARETADLVAAAFSPPLAIEMQRSLYLAEPDGILDVVRGADARARTLLIIGHNPGIADLANLMSGAGDAQARAEMSSSFPTAALAVIHLPGEDWHDASYATGELQRFVTPKLLR